MDIPSVHFALLIAHFSLEGSQRERPRARSRGLSDHAAEDRIVKETPTSREASALSQLDFRVD
jgi:hypothetical protein